MNTIYRIVWNVATGKWVVASELAKGRKKKSSAKIAVLALALAGLGAPVAFAAETDSQEKTEEAGEDKTSIITPFFADGGGNDNGNASNVAIGSGATTGNANAVAIGNGAIANNVANVAIGWNANTTGSNTIALGFAATANGNYAMSLGGGSHASAQRATAVGTDAIASGSSSTAVGNASKAATLSSVAFGNGAQAGLDADGNLTGQNQTALGTAAKAVASSGTAIGQASSATGATGATAIGWAATANAAATGGAWSATAVGTHSVADGDGAAALGDSANATGDRTAAFGRGAKATQADATAFGAGSSASAVAGTAVGAKAQAGGTGAAALGNSAAATGNNSVAIGNGAVTAGSFSNAIGAGTKVTSNNSNVVGNAAVASATATNAFGNGAAATAQEAMALGHGAAADAQKSVVIGSQATLSASATNSVALGSGATTSRANVVAVGNGTSNRQIVNLAAGTQDTDAVNLSQLKGTADSIAQAIGGGSTVGSDGKITAPTYSVGGTNVHNVGDAISNIDGRVTQNAGDIIAATRYFKADGLNNGSDDAVASGSRAVSMGAGSAATGDQSIAIGFGAQANTNEGTVAIGANSRASGENSVALGNNSVADRDNVVSVGLGSGVGNGTRQIINVTNGTENTDAVNVQQLKPAIAALGGGATFNANGTVTGPQYTVADLDNGGNKTVNNVGDALGQLNANTTNLNGRVTTNEGDIVNLDGRVTKNEGDIVSIDGRVTNAETNITNLDGRVTTNEGDIVDIRNQLGNGSIGLVQQDEATRDITVAAGKDGGRVDFTGTDGSRKLAGVAEGELSATSTEAVNGSQLFATNERVTKNEGDIVTIGDRVTNAETNITNLDGRVTTNEGDIVDIRNQLGSGSIGLVQQDATTRDITVAAGTDGGRVDFAGTDGSRKLAGVAEGELSATSTEAVNGSQLFATNERVTKNEGDIVTIGDRVTNAETNITNLDGRVTKSEGDIIDLGDRINSGSVGLVRQADAGAEVTVASTTGGKTVNFTGTDGARQLKGVADGEEDTDAVNVSQLKKSGLVGSDGSLMDAVVYDTGSNRSSITLGGVAGTTITNVMAGLVAPGSMDAINGSQLWGVQDQINKLGDRVTTIENGGSAPLPLPSDPVSPGNGSPHFASNGDVGKPATATGDSSVAAGEGAAASGNSSTAMGAGSSATGNNSVAIGAGSVAASDNTVSVGSVGNERRVTNVAAGTERTDAANVGQLQDAMSNMQDWTQGQVNGLSKKIDNVQRQANRGIAASAALVNNMPYLPGKVTLNAGVAAYRGQSAMGVGVSRWSDNGRFNVNAGISAAQGDAPIFRVGVGVVLGD
jgi:trimeric autotransporter adhesin